MIRYYVTDNKGKYILTRFSGATHLVEKSKTKKQPILYAEIARAEYAIKSNRIFNLNFFGVKRSDLVIKEITL